MTVWVFLQQSSNGIKADVFKSEVDVKATLHDFLNVHWPKGVAKAEDDEVAMRQFHHAQSDIKVSVYLTEVL